MRRWRQRASRLSSPTSWRMATSSATTPRSSRRRCSTWRRHRSKPHPPRIAVILAAGKGTRMRSALPKVLHEAAGRPLLAWVVDAARAAGCERILVVVGHGAERVREVIQGDDLTWVLQEEQRGTGHALAQAAPYIDGEATVLVLSGDVPLMKPATLEALAAACEAGLGRNGCGRSRRAGLARPRADRHRTAASRGSSRRATRAGGAGGPADQRRALRAAGAGRLRPPRPPDPEQRPGRALPDRRRHRRGGGRPSRCAWCRSPIRPRRWASTTAPSSPPSIVSSSTATSRC